MTYRFFARADLWDPEAPVKEFTQWADIEARGGMGDELTYFESRDAFEADDAVELIPNPVPGDPLAGATAVIERLEREFGC